MKRYIHEESGEDFIARDEVQEAAVEKMEGFKFVEEVQLEDLNKKKK